MTREEWRKSPQNNPKGNVKGIIAFIFIIIIPFVITWAAWCIEQLCREEHLWSKMREAIKKHLRYLRSEFPSDLAHTRRIKEYKQKEEKQSCLCQLGEPCVMEKIRGQK